MKLNPIFSKPFKKIAYYSILFVTLHWTCVAPAQDIVITFFELNDFDFNLPVTEPKSTEIKKAKGIDAKVTLVSEEDALKAINKKVYDSKRVFKAKQEKGNIGKTSNNNIDDPSDNIFVVELEDLHR